MKKVPINWVKGIKEEDKKDYVDSLKSSMALHKLKEMIDEREKEILNSSINVDTFDSPNWDYKQAYTNGQLQDLRWFKRLLDFI